MLRLGDASAAASYYEVALSKSSIISLGSTVVVQIQGFPKIAEVDCTEDDSVDVTIVESGDEATLKKSEVLLGVLEQDPEKYQERILLNLARCMLQLSELDTVNRPKYLKSAVLASSLVITIASFHEESNSQSLLANSQTALLLRGRALGGLSKWPNAMADAKKVIKAGDAEQGHKLLATLERKKKQQAKQDKKLSKAVCQWVQTATNDAVSDDQQGGNPSQNTREPLDKKPETKRSLVPYSLLSILLPLIVAFLIQKYTIKK